MPDILNLALSPIVEELPIAARDSIQNSANETVLLFLRCYYNALKNGYISLADTNNKRLTEKDFARSVYFLSRYRFEPQSQMSAEQQEEFRKFNRSCDQISLLINMLFIIAFSASVHAKRENHVVLFLLTLMLSWLALSPSLVNARKLNKAIQKEYAGELDTTDHIAALLVDNVYVTRPGSISSMPILLSRAARSLTDSMHKAIADAIPGLGPRPSPGN